MQGKQSLFPPLFPDPPQHTIHIHKTQGYWLLTALSPEHTPFQETTQYTFLRDLSGTEDSEESESFEIDDIFSHLVSAMLGSRESKGMELERQLFGGCFSSIRSECRESLISEFLLLLLQRTVSTRDEIDNKV